MRIGFIGAGIVAQTISKHVLAVGHRVLLSNTPVTDLLHPLGQCPTKYKEALLQGRRAIGPTVPFEGICHMEFADTDQYTRRRRHGGPEVRFSETS
jgi:hypothetical protein